MQLTIKYQTAFKRDYKRIKKSGYDTRLLETIVEKLAAGEELEEKNHDHALTENWNGYRECHITPDWLLIYKIGGGELILFLTRTGSHGDLLGM